MKKIQDLMGTILQRGKYLELKKAGGSEYVTRLGAKGVVAVIAVTNEGKIILLEQYRPALERLIIELPGGLVGDEPGHENEPFEEAASRELLEEAGYRAKRMSIIAAGPSSADLSNEIITFCLAEGLTGDTPREEERYRIIHEVSVLRLDSWLREKEAQGMLIDYRIYAGLYLIRGPWGSC